MKKFLWLLITLAWVSSLHAASDETEMEEAKAVADQFYRAYVKLHPRGLPSKEQMTTLAPLFTNELTAAIEKARAVQRKFIREHPDDKPPYIEGELFTSAWEGAEHFAFGPPQFDSDKPRDRRINIPVYLTHLEGGTIGRWIDVVVLEQGKEGWRIYDIAFGGTWDFGGGSTLRKGLRED